MVTRIAGLLAGLILCASAYGQTADDCIARFEGLKAEFERSAPGAEVNCVDQDWIISLDAEGPLPGISCEGGAWDHWHLEAKSIRGDEEACIMRLRGLDGVEGCGTEEIRIELPTGEAAKWRNYLRNECKR